MIDTQNEFSYEAKEAYLSHIHGSPTEKAYSRSNFYAQRTQIQLKWSSFIITIASLILPYYKRFTTIDPVFLPKRKI